MSRKVFEYFFDPTDLEPFFSEIPSALAGASVRSRSSNERSQPMPIIQEEEKTNPVERASNVAEFEEQTTSRIDKPADGTNKDVGAEIVDSAIPAIDSSDESIKEYGPENVTKPGATQGDNISDTGRSRVRRLLSVHALGQYVFCVRSAIQSAEKGDQRDIDERLPWFTYLPNFKLQLIEDKLLAKITQLAFFVLYGLCLIVLMRMGLAEKNRLIFYPSLFGFLGLSAWAFSILVTIGELALRRHEALHAKPIEPEPCITCIERVNWWSMLNAGYESIEHEQQIQHPELPLEGSPWRVLQRGSVRIPVIKSGGPKLGERKDELYPKHQVRSVAYALLLESMGKFEVPYGLVFPVDSPHGLAFPITDELRDRAVRLLHEFEQKLIASQRHNVQPGLPENRNRCRNCDYGKPIPISPKEADTALKSGQQLVVLKHDSGQLFRCECADRFGSVPPHRVTIKKGLTAVVT